MDKQAKKIFITGANRGLGQKLSSGLEEKGHQVLGHFGLESGDLTEKKECLKVIDTILKEDVDIFFNNAHCDWSQSFLCLELHKIWKANQKRGTIVNIGSQAAVDFKTRPSKNLLYDYQKVSLKELSIQLSHYNPIRIHHFDVGYFETERTAEEKFHRFPKLRIDLVEKIILENVFNDEIYVPYIFFRAFDDQQYAETL